MIRMIPLDGPNGNHFTVESDEPLRIEVRLDPETGHLLAEVYEGVEVDMDQEPVGCYDNDLDNAAWLLSRGKVGA